MHACPDQHARMHGGLLVRDCAYNSPADVSMTTVTSHTSIHLTHPRPPYGSMADKSVHLPQPIGTARAWARSLASILSGPVASLLDHDRGCMCVDAGCTGQMFRLITH